MNYTIRNITANDDGEVAWIIRTVMPEFGASGPGFAIHDPEVDTMSAAYAVDRAVYLVLIDDQQRVVGGGGIAQLTGAEPSVCELRKMYFLPEARGKGCGAKLLSELVCKATEFGYEKIYLETLTGMDAAQRLYLRLGFKPICQPMGNTGHFACDHWYIKELT